MGTAAMDARRAINKPSEKNVLQFCILVYIRRPETQALRVASPISRDCSHVVRSASSFLRRTLPSCLAHNALTGTRDHTCKEGD